jgi:hypothetical protein
MIIIPKYLTDQLSLNWHNNSFNLNSATSYLSFIYWFHSNWYSFMQKNPAEKISSGGTIIC